MTKQQLLLALSCLLVCLSATATTPREWVGTYSDEQLAAAKRLTLPRILLYDQSGRLMARRYWPPELQDIKRKAGDAFCCVSDKPSVPGSSGPPPDCKIIVYGKNVYEHFGGLVSPSGLRLRYRDLPPHKYLVVDYFADWCAPCRPSRNALESFLQTPTGADYVVVVVDFSSLPNAHERLQQHLQPRQ